MTQIGKSYTENECITTFEVDEIDEGRRLDQYVLQQFTSFSREAIKNKILLGDITILGRSPPHRPSVKVHTKDIIRMVTRDSGAEDEFWCGKKLELNKNPEIVFEDNHLVVLSKPAFMSTHPTGRHLFNCATVIVEKKLKQVVHSIHRLDRETSGLLLMAKNPSAAQLLTENFEKSDVKKVYFFIAKVTEVFQGQLNFSANERLDAPEHGSKRVVIEAYPPNSTEGKSALTHFKILLIENGYALGLAFPQTGRQHQIRVHAKVHGLPLIGDKIYLGSYEMFQHFKDQLATDEEYNLMELPRHALHATAIKFPYRGIDYKFKAALPEDFVTWLGHKTPNVNLSSLSKMIEKEIDLYFS